MRHHPGRYLDALDRHLELLEWWRNPDRGLLFAEGWIKVQDKRSEAKPKGFAVTWTADGDYEAPIAMAGTEYQRLRRAETFWVSRDMGKVVASVAADLPDAPLHPMDLPAASGFVYFEDAVPMLDVNGRTTVVKAMAWNSSMVRTGVPGDDHLPIMPTTLVSIYTDRDDTRDDFVAMLAEKGHPDVMQFTKLVPLDWMMWPWVKAPDDDPDADSDARLLVPVFDDASITSDRAEAILTRPDLRLTPQDTDWSNLLVALWRVSTQKLAVMERRPLDRPTRRRIERAKLAPEWGDLRIIDLRRAVYPSRDRDGDGLTDEEYLQRWTHRWVVGGKTGHWRNQWYASEQRHKWILIEPYIKGPAHLPLVVKDNLYRVVQ